MCNSSHCSYFTNYFYSLCHFSFGDGYLNKSLTGGVGMALPGPLGTAKDLTFVSVLDKNGRPLQQASSVEVWNTHKNNIRTYPIIGKVLEYIQEFNLRLSKFKSLC